MSKKPTVTIGDVDTDVSFDVETQKVTLKLRITNIQIEADLTYDYCEQAGVYATRECDACAGYPTCPLHQTLEAKR